MALKVALGVIANKIACDETNRSLCLNLPRETLADRMHAFRNYNYARVHCGWMAKASHAHHDKELTQILFGKGSFHFILKFILHSKYSRLRHGTSRSKAVAH